MRPGDRPPRHRRATLHAWARQRDGGFTYLLVLFIVAGMGLFVGRSGVVWQQVAQREREADLLAIGMEFGRALASYQRASPDRSLPRRLEDLVDDRRSGVPVRHLRRIYRDPMTGERRWGLEAAGGRISGVYSLAPGEPIRHYDLPPELSEKAQEATRYSDWVFRSAEEGSAPPPQAAEQISPAVSAPAQQ